MIIKMKNPNTHLRGVGIKIVTAVENEMEKYRALLIFLCRAML